ncbi:MAG: hypothetical protein K1000chlam2_00096 [Chlamydiae bacterium]|nr:hypothetical protein [Chlamydiota bacterium]
MIKTPKIAFLLIIFISFFVIFLNTIQRENADFEIPIAFSKDIFPLVTVLVEEKPYSLKLCLSSKYPLHLSKKNLTGIQKSKQGEASWKNIKGEQFHAPLFEIKKVQLASLKFKNLKTCTDSGENGGAIAWPFDRLNLVLDFPHQKIYGIKNEKNLRNLGFDLKKMEKIKCNINKKGIYFKSNTSIGEVTMCISTNCNVNIIKDTLVNSDTSQHLNTKIKNKDCGIQTFLPVEITSELEMDAVLGVGFLKNHIVYIDSQNEYLYIGDKYANSLSGNSPTKIPVDFTTHGIPVVDIQVAEQRMKAKVDLGSSFELTLFPKTFPPQELKYLQTTTSFNGLGEESKTEHYALPEYQIHNITLKNAYIDKTEKMGVPLGLKLDKLGTISNENLAYIGLPLLYRTNIFFDFPNSSLHFIEQGQNLKKVNLRLEEYKKIPFELEKCGIVLNIESDLGPLKYMMDTGASVSVIKPEFLKKQSLSTDTHGNSIFVSSTFTIGNYDYGEKYLYPFNITPELGNIQGILGMDFLREHAFYIDFPNRLLYLQMIK